MSSKRRSAYLLIAASVLFVAACQDAPAPTAPADQDQAAPAQTSRAPAFQEQEMAAWFARSAPEVLALPQTVFADHDESANRLVFGVEHRGVIRGVETVLTRLGIPSSAYQVKVTEPIHLMSTLRDQHRPTLGGIQIRFSNFLCTLGFSVDHSGGRSFITNSHCTDQQGGTEGTVYFQPLSTSDPPIGVEVDDPEYFRGGECPRGRKCRWSDAARALYESGIESLGEIARTSGANNGSLDVVGTFDITSQDNSTTSFGGTLNKVGRTTGWTEGNVFSTCATVNVSGTNITQLCQTLVRKSGTTIVGGGDSGSPVFKTTGSNSAELVGILWGGNSSGDLFVFSPFKNIQDELGTMDATTDLTGGGGGGTNAAPTAGDVSVAGDEDTTIPWAPDVSDPDGDPLGCSIATQPANGSATVQADCSGGSYTPDPDFHGDDGFAYGVSDGNGGSDTGAVSVTVNPVNDAPVAEDDAYSAEADATLSVAAPGVLGNDGDVDGDALTAQWASGPSSGSLTLNADGSFNYTPEAGFEGTDQFTYTASDATLSSAEATVTITVSSTSTPATMHVGDLDGASQKLSQGQWKAVVTVTVHDASHSAVSDATVTGEFRQNGDVIPGSCPTATDGTCSIDSGTFPNNSGKASFVVTGVSHGTLTYSAADNHDPDGDSDGTTIELSK